MAKNEEKSLVQLAFKKTQLFANSGYLKIQFRIPYPSLGEDIIILFWETNPTTKNSSENFSQIYITPLHKMNNNAVHCSVSILKKNYSRHRAALSQSPHVNNTIALFRNNA